jgi:hypothetical protein
LSGCGGALLVRFIDQEVISSRGGFRQLIGEFVAAVTRMTW